MFTTLDFSDILDGQCTSSITITRDVDRIINVVQIKLFTFNTQALSCVVLDSVRICNSVRCVMDY